MKYKSIFNLFSLALIGASLTACGGSGGDASGSTPAKLNASESTLLQIPNQIATGRAPSAEDKLSVFEESQTSLAAFTNDDSKVVKILSIQKPTIGADLINFNDSMEVAPNASCYNGQVGATLKAGESCFISYTIKSDNPAEVSGAFVVNMSGASRETISIPVQTQIKPQNEIDNSITIVNPVVFAPDNASELIIKNNNNNPLQHVEVDLSALPQDVFNEIDQQSISGGKLNLDIKRIALNDSALQPGQEAIVSFKLKDTAAGMLTKYYNELSTQQLLSVISDNSSNESANVAVETMPMLLQSINADKPGEYVQSLVNSTNSDFVISDMQIGKLPNDVKITGGTCKVGSVIKANSSCSIIYTVGSDAYTIGNTAVANPVTISYHPSSDSTISYSTKDQLTPATLNVSPVHIAFMFKSFEVQPGSSTEDVVTNVQLVNAGSFNWQLSTQKTNFAIKSAQGSSTPPIGLSVVDPIGGAVSCFSSSVVKPGASCEIGIKSADEQINIDELYMLEMTQFNNTDGAISNTFPISTGAVSASISADAGTYYPSIKSIKVTNGNATTRAITASFSGADANKFEVYDQSATQTWCSPTLCPDSCYTQDHPYKAAADSAPIAVAEGGIAGVCYVYTHAAKPYEIGTDTSADISISKLGETATQSKSFALASETALIVGGNFGTYDRENFLAKYSKSGWSNIHTDVKQAQTYALASDIQGNIAFKSSAPSQFLTTLSDNYQPFGSGSFAGNAISNGEGGWYATTLSKDSFGHYLVQKIDKDGNVQSLGSGPSDSPFKGFVDRLLLAPDGALYVAGNAIDSAEHYYVAKYDHGIWSSLGGGPNESPFNGPIYAMVNDKEGNIYVAGAFTDQKGQQYIAKYQDGQWSNLGGAQDKPFNGTINALAIDSDDNLYAGGLFNIDGLNYVAKYSHGAWTSLGSGSESVDLNKSINSIVIDGNNNLYIGGHFFDKQGHYYIAEYHNGDWINLGSGPSASLFNGIITKLVKNNRLSISANA